MPKGESELDRFYPLSIANSRYRELVESLSKEMSQERVGRALGISQAYVSSVIGGGRKVSAAAVELAAKKLGLDPGWFFDPYAGDWRKNTKLRGNSEGGGGGAKVHRFKKR